MTCAPRGILSTKSDSVGRTARYGLLRVDCTVEPSGEPITESWGTKPAWEWNSPPSFRVTR